VVALFSFLRGVKKKRGWGGGGGGRTGCRLTPTGNFHNLKKR